MRSGYLVARLSAIVRGHGLVRAGDVAEESAAVVQVDPRLWEPLRVRFPATAVDPAPPVLTLPDPEVPIEDDEPDAISVPTPETPVRRLRTTRRRKSA